MFHSFQEIENFFTEREQYGMKPGLERVEFLLKYVNHPEKKVKGIHVAGTNGKGSTIQFIHDALIAHNYEVGLFTSPSFTGITGHILMNGEPITSVDLIRLLNKLLPFIHQLDAKQNHPTSFEILTVLSFMYFEEKADIVLVEVGMGGKLDTTNCFTPIISVITTIARDHTAFLGETIEEIAAHKAGIIKKHRPVVTGKMDDVAMSIITETADRLSSPIYACNQAYSIHNQSIRIHFKQLEMNINQAMLQGIHQKENAATALMTLALLSDYGYTFHWKTVEQSVMKTTLPGRFEMIHKNPSIILDSAHNVAGIQAFRQTLLEQKYNRPTHLLFAGFYDKQLTEMLSQLAPIFTSITLTTFEHHRAATLTDWKDNICPFDYQVEADWRKAIDYMLEQESKDIYCVTGSLHFITRVRNYILDESTS